MSKVKNRIIAYINKNLEHDDQFENISNRLNLQKIQKKEIKYYMDRPKVLKFILPCLVLLFVAVFGVILLSPKPTVMDKEPIAVVQMDVNPSISFVIDEDGTIISVYGENDEGKMIINGEEIIGLKLEVAIEKIIELESQTGYLLKGNVEAGENNISFSIEANTTEIAVQLESQVKTCVANICDELSIQETIQIIKSNAKAELVKRAMAIDPTLTEEEANAKTNKELLDYIKGCQLEKIDIPTEEIEQLYNRVKTQKIELVEREHTKKVIDGLDSAYQDTRETYQVLYQALITAQTALNEAYIKYFVNEDSGYQKALNEYQNLKLEVIRLENEIAQMEDSPEKTIQEGILKTKKMVLDSTLKGLETSKQLAEIAIKAISDTIDLALKNMDDFYNQLPTEIKTRVTESITDLEQDINNAKNNMFEEFETNYKDEIEAAYKNAKEYKESLIEQLKN